MRELLCSWISGKVRFDGDGVGDSATVPEGRVGGAVDEAHGSAVGVFVVYVVKAVAPLLEVWFAAVGLRPGVYCRFEGRNHPVLLSPEDCWVQFTA